MSKPLRVAVVDDSSFVRRAIERMFQADPEVKIVGVAASGEELLNHLEEWRPDAITLDLSMPGMGGLATLDRIMTSRPTPVIILSTHSAKDAPLTIEALHRGAVDFIDKQRYSLVDFDALRTIIVDKLRHVTAGRLPQPSGERVERGERGERVEREPSPATAAPPPRETAPAAKPAAAKPAPAKSPAAAASKPARATKPRRSPRFDALVIGASTGGPPTIQRLLEDLGDEVVVPIVIVQHMPAGFTRAFAERLNAYLPLHVREAEDAEVLLPSTVYIAPAGQHLRLKKRGEDLLAVLGYEPDDLTHRPSVDVLFSSAAEVLGRRAIGVLLTGMGSDGAQGLSMIKALGGHTVVQDEASCIVYGMPRMAVQMRAHQEQVALADLGRRLTHLLETSA